MVIYGRIWPYIAVYDHIYRYSRIWQYISPYLTVYGPIYIANRVKYSRIWRYIVAYGYKADASMRQAYPGTCKPCSVVHLNDNAYTLVETLVGENHCSATVLHREGAERVPVPGRPTITSCLCHQRKEPKLITALAGRQRQEPA